MTPTYQLKKHHVNTMHKLAVFIAWACVFQMIEFIFPSPLPGVRLGLANMITLVVLFQMGFASALEVAIVRVLISSILVGTFLSPTFMLSMAGAITSSLVMGAIYHLSVRQEYVRFSLVGISIWGSVTHTMTQLVLVYVLLVKHPGIFWLTPWLLLSALVMGCVTGVLARQMCKDLDGASLELGRKEVQALLTRAQQKVTEGITPSLLRRINPTLKILYVTVVALLIIFIVDKWFYLGMLVLTIFLAGLGKIPAAKLWIGLRKMSFFLLITFILDLFFTHQGMPLVQLAGVTITTTGVKNGVLFVARLVILLLNSYVVSLSSTPEELATHLARILSPLRIVKFSTRRFARIMMMAWMLVPSLLEQAFRFLKESASSLKALRHIATSLSALILLSMDPERSETTEEVAIAYLLRKK